MTAPFKSPTLHYMLQHEWHYSITVISSNMTLNVCALKVWPFCSDYNHKRSLRHRSPHHITRGHLRSVSVQINYLRLLSGGLVASALSRWWRLHLRGIMIMKDPSAVNKHDCNLRRFMKHMRSFSSHRNNINTITITAGVESGLHKICFTRSIYLLQ